jgi:hypothetical protein
MMYSTVFEKPEVTEDRAARFYIRVAIARWLGFVLFTLPA